MRHKQEAGFTLVELLLVIVVLGIVAGSFFRFFGSTLIGYLHLQSDASNSATIASQSQRVASVVRSTTGIIAANGNDLQVYAYFYPSDVYVSQVHYYLNSASSILYADVTPMSSNPPLGTPLTAQKKTYIVATSFYLPTNGSLFTYLDASNTSLSTPVSDLNAVKLIQVNLAFKTADGKNQVLSLQVALRNRKTNL